MQRVPLAERLRRRAHRDVAYAQDVLVAEVYEAFPDAVIHGGTAIWRCYGGTRFSEDVDVYAPGEGSAPSVRLREGLSAKGVREVKFKATRSTIFGRFELAGAQVSLEAALRPAPARVVMPYETVGGGSMLVGTLPAEELLAEKASAYLDRKKVRDLYDVFFLLGRVGDRTEVAGPLGELAAGYEPPVDPAQLKAVVLAGAVPTAEEMIEGIRRWAGRST